MRVYVRRAISKHSYHSSEVGAYRWHYYAASTIDGSCNYILEGEPKKRFDWSIFWDLLIRWRAWRGLPKQSKSKLSYTPIEWIVIIISMNAVWIKRTIRFHSEGVVWKEAWMYVVVCLVSVLLFRGYRYPFLPPSQIIIASPLPSAWDLHASCAALWCCSFELIVRPSVGNVAKKTVSGIRHIQLAIVISIPETYVSSFGILSLAQSLCTETCCLLSII